ncbi:MAG: hypothetical protein JXA60_04930 [Candidatus Coatesbacteria bacterium]|nr:hypothetical protein [Candidatus Coatesbacteria bacterium]
MKKSLIILLLLCFAISCGNDPFFKEREADFFPFDIYGNEWTYSVNDNEEEVWKVQGSETYAGYEGSLLVAGLDTLIFYRNSNDMMIYVNSSGYFDATKYNLQDSWQKYISTPLITGRIWNDLYEENIEIYGVMVKYSSSIKGTVLSRESVKVPVGEIDNCYKVEISIQKSVETSLPGFEHIQKYQHYIIWLASDIGIIKKKDLINNKTWSLKSYKIE